MQPRLFDGLHGRELSATDDEFFDRGSVFRLFFPGTRSHLLGEAGERIGVDPIGLRQATDAAGKVANLSRIDARNGVARLQEMGGQAALEAAGGLDDDQARRVRSQGCEQLREAGVVGRKPQRLRRRRDVDVPMLLGDVDSDERTDR